MWNSMKRRGGDVHAVYFDRKHGAPHPRNASFNLSRTWRLYAGSCEARRWQHFPAHAAPTMGCRGKGLLDATHPLCRRRPSHRMVCHPSPGDGNDLSSNGSQVCGDRRALADSSPGSKGEGVENSESQQHISRGVGDLDAVIHQALLSLYFRYRREAFHDRPSQPNTPGRWPRSTPPRASTS